MGSRSIKNIELRGDKQRGGATEHTISPFDRVDKFWEGYSGNNKDYWVSDAHRCLLDGFLDSGTPADDLHNDQRVFLMLLARSILKHDKKGPIDQDDPVSSGGRLVLPKLGNLAEIATFYLSQRTDLGLGDRMYDLAPRHAIEGAAKIAVAIFSARDNIALSPNSVLLVGLRMLTSQKGDAREASVETPEQQLLKHFAASDRLSSLSKMLIRIANAEGLLAKEPIQLSREILKPGIGLDGAACSSLEQILRDAPIDNRALIKDRDLFKDLQRTFAENNLISGYLRIVYPSLTLHSRDLTNHTPFYLAACLLRGLGPDTSVDNLNPSMIAKALTRAYLLSASVSLDQLDANKLNNLGSDLNSHALSREDPLLKKISNRNLSALCWSTPVFKGVHAKDIGPVFEAWRAIYAEVFERFKEAPRSKTLRGAVARGVACLNGQQFLDTRVEHVEISRSPFRASLKDSLVEFFGASRAARIEQEWVVEAADKLADSTCIVRGLSNIVTLERAFPNSARTLNKTFGTTMFGRYRYQTLVDQYLISQSILPDGSLSVTAQSKPIFVLLGCDDDTAAMSQVPRWGSYNRDAIFFEALSPRQCLIALMRYYRMYGAIESGAIHAHGGSKGTIYLSATRNLPLSGLGSQAARKIISTVIAPGAFLLVDACYGASSNRSLAASLKDILSGQNVTIFGPPGYEPLDSLRRVSDGTFKPVYRDKRGKDVTEIKRS